tara:strand:- start:37 stop:255 length:219 start_codon:yes stop_codon:yes gene_type:complete
MRMNIEGEAQLKVIAALMGETVEEVKQLIEELKLVGAVQTKETPSGDKVVTLSEEWKGEVDAWIREDEQPKG